MLEQAEITVDVSAGSVYIYPKGGIRFFRIHFSGVGGGVTPPAAVSYFWNFSSAEWQAALDAAAPSAKGSNQAEWTVSLDGLTYTSGTKNGKWDTTYIQPNGGGSATERVFSFDAPVAGTVKIDAQSANSSETRAVAVVDVSGVEQTKDFLERATVEVEVEAGMVYIYPKAGVRFFSIAFTNE